MAVQDPTSGEGLRLWGHYSRARVNSKIGEKPRIKLKGHTDQDSAVGAVCSRDSIRSVVALKSNAIENCYNKALQLKPTLNGRVTVRWTISHTGYVVKADIHSSTLDDKEVENCMIRTIMRWRFGPPTAGHCVISYPFSFRSPAQSG